VQDVVLGEDLTAYVGLVRTRPLYVVVLAPDAETVAAREAARTKTGYGPAWTIPALDEALRESTPPLGLWLDTSALDEALRESTPPLGLWLDTSAQTPAQTVEAILAGRERARVL
jgi:hypothetical protein